MDEKNKIGMKVPHLHRIFLMYITKLRKKWN